jgi:hypothetical protein
MGNASSRAGEDQYNAVTGRAIGITGGGALKRVAAPKLPAGAIKSSPEDYSFIEVCKEQSTCAMLSASLFDTWPSSLQEEVLACHAWNVAI